MAVHQSNPEREAYFTSRRLFLGTLDSTFSVTGVTALRHLRHRWHANARMHGGICARAFTAGRPSDWSNVT
jgi:hypothetical protein